ncbi:helix-turn-helix domain-containing protein [Marinomonas sp. M1K-6]|uniref:Helix-turn-helix domain-containing protein n=1 Tax=Marinomonas profundi TaxID=2726122 RepID=A0A847QZA9_9GAMM|nr:helix-turn-helix domain-containing protein [Marinomonas profundi]NLQ16172.1 helix-turn-helix domain-containing protein [Marinomonas profundi]UDV03244.1 helix-turn-helix domain-containing protein [Marinomonas profundi]
MSAIAKAVEIIGGQTALANILGVKQAHVWNWLRVHKRSPAKYIRRISKATNGQVTESELLKDHEV